MVYEAVSTSICMYSHLKSNNKGAHPEACSSFVANTWREDLCSNCMRQLKEHSTSHGTHAVEGMSSASTGEIKRRSDLSVVQKEQASQSEGVGRMSHDQPDHSGGGKMSHDRPNHSGVGRMSHDHGSRPPLIGCDISRHVSNMCVDQGNSNNNNNNNNVADRRSLAEFRNGKAAVVAKLESDLSTIVGPRPRRAKTTTGRVRDAASRLHQQHEQPAPSNPATPSNPSLKQPVSNHSRRTERKYDVHHSGQTKANKYTSESCTAEGKHPVTGRNSRIISSAAQKKQFPKSVEMELSKSVLVLNASSGPDGGAVGKNGHMKRSREARRSLPAPPALPPAQTEVEAIFGPRSGNNPPSPLLQPLGSPRGHLASGNTAGAAGLRPKGGRAAVADSLRERLAAFDDGMSDSTGKPSSRYSSSAESSPRQHTFTSGSAQQQVLTSGSPRPTTAPPAAPSAALNFPFAAVNVTSASNLPPAVAVGPKSATSLGKAKEIVLIEASSDRLRDNSKSGCEQGNNGTAVAVETDHTASVETAPVKEALLKSHQHLRENSELEDVFLSAESGSDDSDDNDGGTLKANKGQGQLVQGHKKVHQVQGRSQETQPPGTVLIPPSRKKGQGRPTEPPCPPPEAKRPTIPTSSALAEVNNPTDSQEKGSQNRDLQEKPLQRQPSDREFFRGEKANRFAEEGLSKVQSSKLGATISGDKVKDHSEVQEKGTMDDAGGALTGLSRETKPEPHGHMHSQYQPPRSRELIRGAANDTGAYEVVYGDGEGSLTLSQPAGVPQGNSAPIDPPGPTGSPPRSPVPPRRIRIITPDGPLSNHPPEFLHLHRRSREYEDIVKTLSPLAGGPTLIYDTPCADSSDTGSDEDGNGASHVSNKFRSKDSFDGVRNRILHRSLPRNYSRPSAATIHRAPPIATKPKWLMQSGQNSHKFNGEKTERNEPVEGQRAPESDTPAELFRRRSRPKYHAYEEVDVVEMEEKEIGRGHDVSGITGSGIIVSSRPVDDDRMYASIDSPMGSSGNMLAAGEITQNSVQERAQKIARALEKKRAAPPPPPTKNTGKVPSANNESAVTGEMSPDWSPADHVYDLEASEAAKLAAVNKSVTLPAGLDITEWNYYGVDAQKPKTPKAKTSFMKLKSLLRRGGKKDADPDDELAPIPPFVESWVSGTLQGDTTDDPLAMEGVWPYDPASTFTQVQAKALLEPKDNQLSVSIDPHSPTHLVLNSKGRGTDSTTNRTTAATGDREPITEEVRGHTGSSSISSPAHMVAGAAAITSRSKRRPVQDSDFEQHQFRSHSKKMAPPPPRPQDVSSGGGKKDSLVSPTGYRPVGVSTRQTNALQAELKGVDRNTLLKRVPAPQPVKGARLSEDVTGNKNHGEAQKPLGLPKLPLTSTVSAPSTADLQFVDDDNIYDLPWNDQEVIFQEKLRQTMPMVASSHPAHSGTDQLDTAASSCDEHNVSSPPASAIRPSSAIRPDWLHVPGQVSPYAAGLLTEETDKLSPGYLAPSNEAGQLTSSGKAAAPPPPTSPPQFSPPAPPQMGGFSSAPRSSPPQPPVDAAYNRVPPFSAKPALSSFAASSISDKKLRLKSDGDVRGGGDKAAQVGLNNNVDNSGRQSPPSIKIRSTSGIFKPRPNTKPPSLKRPTQDLSSKLQPEARPQSPSSTSSDKHSSISEEGSTAAAVRAAAKSQLTLKSECMHRVDSGNQTALRKMAATFAETHHSSPCGAVAEDLPALGSLCWDDFQLVEPTNSKEKERSEECIMGHPVCVCAVTGTAFYRARLRVRASGDTKHVKSGGVQNRVDGCPAYLLMISVDDSSQVPDIPHPNFLPTTPRFKALLPVASLPDPLFQVYSQIKGLTNAERDQAGGRRKRYENVSLSDDEKLEPGKTVACRVTVLGFRGSGSSLPVTLSRYYSMATKQVQTGSNGSSRSGSNGTVSASSNSDLQLTSDLKLTSDLPILTDEDVAYVLYQMLRAHRVALRFNYLLSAEPACTLVRRSADGSLRTLFNPMRLRPSSNSTDSKRNQSAPLFDISGIISVLHLIRPATDEENNVNVSGFFSRVARMLGDFHAAMVAGGLPDPSAGVERIMSVLACRIWGPSVDDTKNLRQTGQSSGRPSLSDLLLAWLVMRRAMYVQQAACEGGVSGPWEGDRAEFLAGITVPGLVAAFNVVHADD